MLYVIRTSDRHRRRPARLHGAGCGQLGGAPGLASGWTAHGMRLFSATRGHLVDLHGSGGRRIRHRPTAFDPEPEGADAVRRPAGLRCVLRGSGRDCGRLMDRGADRRRDRRGDRHLRWGRGAHPARRRVRAGPSGRVSSRTPSRPFAAPSSFGRSGEPTVRCDRDRGWPGRPPDGRAAGGGRHEGRAHRARAVGGTASTPVHADQDMVASAQAAHLARRGEYVVVTGGPVGVDIRAVKARKKAVVGKSRSHRRPGWEAWRIVRYPGPRTLFRPSRLQSATTVDAERSSST